MQKILLISAVLFAVILTSYAISVAERQALAQRIKSRIEDPPQPGTLNVWPKPQSFSAGASTLQLDWSSFRMTVESAQQSDILTKAISRYQRMVFYDTSKPASSGSIVKGLQIYVQDVSPVLQLGVDETYELQIPNASPFFTLRATTVWGALRGLETFSQLVDLNYTQTVYAKNRNYFISNTPIVVKDKPRFQWRGLMIDTARHYLSIDTILRIIDAMSYNKLNTLHWHMVDAQSFPIEIAAFPLLNQKGAWRFPAATYSKKDIANIVEYARERGIRVVPEIDVPGHTASWGYGYPSITAKCPKLSASNINVVPLNPAVNLTYDIVNSVLNEIGAIVPDQYMHLGGDEVVNECWAADPSVVEFMSTMGFTTYAQLRAYFQTKIEPFYRNAKKTMVCWEELLLDSSYTVPSDTIVQAWLSIDALYKIVQRGYRALLSSQWYLDQQNPTQGKTSWYGFEDTWKDFYNNEPTAGHSYTPQQLELLLGGEACMWGEKVDDTNIDSWVWPRASAVAERLWSPKDVNSVTEALPRLQTFRCRMVNRGIAAGPLAPDFCPAVYGL